MSQVQRSSALTLLQQSELILDEELCLNLRGRMEVCSACSDQCHSEALQLSVDAVDLDAERCTGCGGCVPVCPAGVMRMSGFSPVRFVQTAKGNESLHLHCSASQDGGGGVVIPCFKLLDARLVSALAGEGVQRVLLHGMSQCDGCNMGDARPAIEFLKSTLERWFGDESPLLIPAEQDSDQDTGERHLEDQPHMNRRNFLRLLGAKATAEASSWFCPTADSDEQEAALLPFFQADGQPQRPVVYQQLLADSIEALPWRQQQPLPWRSRVISEGCSACLVCAERCPTGALQALEQGLDRQVSFQPSLCTDCGLCQQLCPEASITSSELHLVADVRKARGLLMQRRARQCAGCGQPFMGDSGAALCPVCSNEQDLDDEWLGMLEG